MLTMCVFFFYHNKFMYTYKHELNDGLILIGLVPSLTITIIIIISITTIYSL